MTDCCLIKKVATVEVYENKNEVRAYGFMAGDRNTPVMEVRFKHLWGEDNLSTCKLRWIIVDDVGSLLVGEVPIQSDNTALINLPNELFTGERRMKVQLTVASCDGKRILNLQQFTDLKVINNLATNEVVEPVYNILINTLYDESQKYLKELEISYTEKYGGLENLYLTAKSSLEEYLVNAENGGNAEFLQGYVPFNFNRVENTMAELQASSKYKLGDVVEVLGYYTAGDGAGHPRKASNVDDGSGVLGANGLWWNIVHNGEVNISWFGVLKDSDNFSNSLTSDNEIKKAISISDVNTINLDVTNVLLTGGILIERQLNLNFKECMVYYTGENGFCFKFNANDIWKKVTFYSNKEVIKTDETKTGNFIICSDSWGSVFNFNIIRNFSNNSFILLKNENMWTEGVDINIKMSRNCYRTLEFVGSDKHSSFYRTKANIYGSPAGDGVLIRATEKANIYQSEINLTLWKEKGGSYAMFVNGGCRVSGSIFVNADGDGGDGFRVVHSNGGIIDCVGNIDLTQGNRGRNFINELSKTRRSIQQALSNEPKYSVSECYSNVRIKGLTYKLFGNIKETTSFTETLYPYSSFLLTITLHGNNNFYKHIYKIDCLDFNFIATVTKEVGGKETPQISVTTHQNKNGASYWANLGCKFDVTIDPADKTKGFDIYYELEML